MALRSGYKGFKKLLGLKTIRPGTLAVDDAVLSETFFPRSEQAVLGARNSLYVPNKTVTDSDIEMVATDGELSITGQNSGSSAMWVTFSPVSVPKGSFKFKVSGLTANGVTNMQLQTSSGTTILAVNSAEPEAIGDISANADNYKLFIRIAAGANLSAAKVFPQLLQPSDDFNVNSSYAMTNRELTEIKAGTIDLSHSESTTTPSAHVERTHLKRIGRTCILDFWINFVTVSETSTWKELLRVDLKPTKPALVVCGTGDGHICAGILDIGGSLKIYPTSAIDNNSVYGQVVYFI